MEAHSLIGANPERATDEPEFNLGDRLHGDQNREFIYVQADGDGITGPGYAALIKSDYTADMLDNTNGGAAFGQKIGIAEAAFGANQYGWLRVTGKGPVRVEADTSNNAALNSTGTEGQLGDDASGGTANLNQIVLAETVSGSAGIGQGWLNNPTIAGTN